MVSVKIVANERQKNQKIPTASSIQISSKISNILRQMKRRKRIEEVLRINSSHKTALPNRSPPATIKSKILQFTSVVNGMVTKGSKRNNAATDSKMMNLLFSMPTKIDQN